jgi:thiamine kinase-like enzyme
MIPQEKSDAVFQGLREAFGVTSFDDIRRLTGGRSPGIHVFRIVVQGHPFLLRIIMRTDDPTRHFTCMRAAAEAGLAPQVWYTSIPDRISITDFVEAVPFPRTNAPRRMAATLRTLHALTPFPTVPNHINTSCMFLINKGPAVDDFIGKVQAANIFSKSESEELFARYEQLAAVYPLHDPDMVSSHNDLFKPDNILFDGDRVWLVDWEAAFLNDRYADLAVVANLVVTNEAEESIYLQEYFGQPPDAYQLARFFLMQQIAHVFYAIAFLWAGSLGGPVSQGENAPQWREFHRQFWTGAVKLEDNQMKTAYGRVHLEQLLQNVREPRFNEAMRVISEPNRSQEAVRVPLSSAP